MHMAHLHMHMAHLHVHMANLHTPNAVHATLTRIYLLHAMRPDKGSPPQSHTTRSNLLRVRSVLKWDYKEINFEGPAGWKST